MLIITFLFRKYISRKIGGYTGDCLGALQQISEVGFYLGVLIISR
jgi:adenosylcobinamide-GDP ribazoletransferase